VVIGASLYALGHVLRRSLAGAWEPVVPVGFLVPIVSLVLLGVGTLRAPAAAPPRWAGGAVLASGLCLLAFNDQYASAWAAVPFGLLWVVLGVFLLVGRATHPGGARTDIRS
jgi:hypothetical protein